MGISAPRRSVNRTDGRVSLRSDFTWITPEAGLGYTLRKSVAEASGSWLAKMVVQLMPVPMVPAGGGTGSGIQAPNSSAPISYGAVRAAPS